VRGEDKDGFGPMSNAGFKGRHLRALPTLFAGEISLAAKVIGDRFATQQRTLLLVNDQRDLKSRLLASVTGLKLALADIGRRMDRECPGRSLLYSPYRQVSSCGF
jgi:hypothetical protein